MEYEGIKIIHTYKGKKVTQTFFKDNRRLFTEPSPHVLDSAIKLLKRMTKNKKKYNIFIDEKGNVSYVDPE